MNDESIRNLYAPGGVRAPNPQLLILGNPSGPIISQPSARKGGWDQFSPTPEFVGVNPGRGVLDPVAARELELFIVNDGQLYNQRHVPIIKNLMRKKAAGTYNRDKAAKLFLYLADDGAKRYTAQFGTPGVNIFNLETRWAVAKSLRDSFEAEERLGNYDTFINVRVTGAKPKPGQFHPTQHDTPHNSEFCNKCQHETYCSVCRSKNPSSRKRRESPIHGGFTVVNISHPRGNIGWFSTEGEAKRHADFMNQRGGTVYEVRPFNPGWDPLTPTPHHYGVNPPSFIVIDSRGLKVVYTARATGTGQSALEKAGREAAHRAKRDKRHYYVLLNISPNIKRGSVVNEMLLFHANATAYSPLGATVQYGMKENPGMMRAFGEGAAGGIGFGLAQMLMRGGVPLPNPSRQTDKQFLEFLQNTLIPDLTASGTIETAESMAQGLTFMRGMPGGRGRAALQYSAWLQSVLVPDLRASGNTYTANDFARLARLIDKKYLGGSRKQNGCPLPNPATVPPWMMNDPEFKRELETFYRRHGKNTPVEIFKVKVPKGFPKFMTAYGQAPVALYDAHKTSTKGKRIHHFGEGKAKGKKPWLVSSAQRGNKFLAYVGGGFEARPDWLYY